MCGIVGYLGSQESQGIIIEGLKRLEYRGYDSAGLAIFDGQRIQRVRAEGKLSQLEKKLVHEPLQGTIGIGHTRWATHGGPSERNAHPHQAGKISLVHNGIIENYQEIRQELLARGLSIQSDTDTELVAHLLDLDIQKTSDLKKSVLNVLPRLRGAFSILVLWEDRPDQLVAFKDGPPLVVGRGKNEMFVASDVQAAVMHTQDFLYLEDREIVVVDRSRCEVFNTRGEKVPRDFQKVDVSAEQSEKKGFAHYMLKEIYEQPRAIAASIAPHIDLSRHVVEFAHLGLPLEKLKQFDRLTIVACGTSYYAGMVGKYYFERIAGIQTDVDIASEYRYRHPVLSPNQAVLVISQSGETADTLAALRLAKKAQVTTLSLCNVSRSSIDREADGHIAMNSGVEIGVASTKAFVSSLALLQLLAIQIGRLRNFCSAEDEQKYVRALLAVPSQIEAVLAYDKYFSEAANSLKLYKGFLYMARGPLFPIALEGALKLKELAYVHSEGYAAGELKHGPLALVDQDMAIVTIVTEDEWFEKTMSNLEEVKARGGQIISIGTGEQPQLKKVSQSYLSLPKAMWTNNPFLAVVPLQLMAYHLAQSLGHDVDQPRNLAKSVTVE